MSGDLLETGLYSVSTGLKILDLSMGIFNEYQKHKAHYEKCREIIATIMTDKEENQV